MNNYEITHYGVKGMKWGVRRPSETKKHERTITKKQIDDIRTIMQSLKSNDYNDFSFKGIQNASIKYDGNKPVSFAYSRRYNVDGFDKQGAILSVGTNPNYRKRGYAKELANDIVRQNLRDPSISEITWAAEKSNRGSIKTATSLGFQHWYDYYDSDGPTSVYVYNKDIKHSKDVEEGDMLYNNDDLYHYGVKGMKWGVRRSLEQLGHTVRQRKIKKQRAEALERARQAKRDKADFEANKDRVIKSGTATEVLKYKGKLTNQEMQYALDRINLERKLSEISSKEVKTGMDKLTQVMNKVEKANNAANKAIGAYNTIAKVSNSVAKTNLPTINDGNKTKAKNPIKEALIKKGTPEEIEKNFGDFTVDELRTINTRMTIEDSIRKKINESKKKEEKDD